jgi:hypothetical protein
VLLIESLIGVSTNVGNGDILGVSSSHATTAFIVVTSLEELLWSFLTVLAVHLYCSRLATVTY